MWFLAWWFREKVPDVGWSLSKTLLSRSKMTHNLSSKKDGSNKEKFLVLAGKMSEKEKKKKKEGKERKGKEKRREEK